MEKKGERGRRLKELVKLIDNKFFFNVLKKLYTFFFNNRNFKIDSEKILENIFFSKDKKIIIQIGANDGLMLDPLRRFLIKKGNYKAILIEPLDYYYKNLLKLYKKRKDIKLLKVCISTKKKQKIYFIPPKIADLMNGEGPKNNWAHGQGSSDKEFIIKQIKLNNFRGSDYKKNIQKYINSIIHKNVRTMKISNINIDNKSTIILIIDVQGFELDVLKTVDFKKQKIKYIYYEDEFPHSLKSQKIITLLKKNNYKYIGRDGVNYIYILKSY